jgi:hypothetical protein
METSSKNKPEMF